MSNHSQNFQATGKGLSSSRAQSGAYSRGSSSSRGSLGINVNTRDTLKVEKARKSLRRARFEAKNVAGSLLRSHDENFGSRVSACCRVNYDDCVHLVAKTHESGAVSASMQGLVTCKSVWSCPVCSHRISALRRDELNHLLKWARSEKLAPTMLTLTFRHGRTDVLKENLSKMTKALAAFRQSRGFRGLRLEGAVSATEVTFGENGFHPHQHLILLSPADDPDAVASVEALRSTWLRCLDRAGLSGNDNAFQVQSASATGDYIAKWGAAEELALDGAKKGRSGSRTPWQLLADAAEGDKAAAAAWVEFSLAFKGRRQLVWSRGLKDKCGLNDVDDDDFSAGAEPEDAIVSQVIVRTWFGGTRVWTEASRRICSMLDAVESGGCLDAAEFGLTDAEIWRDQVAASKVLE